MSKAPACSTWMQTDGVRSHRCWLPRLRTRTSLTRGQDRRRWLAAGAAQLLGRSEALHATRKPQRNAMVLANLIGVWKTRGYELGALLMGGQLSGQCTKAALAVQHVCQETCFRR